MNFLAGIRTNDFVILASDKNAFAHGAITISDNHNKEIRVGENLYISVCGEFADVDDFGSWAQANLRLYETRHGYELSPSSAHHWLRQKISYNLRSENFWQINLLIGGYDKISNKAYLGSIDYLGNSIPDQNYLFSGFPGRFCYSIVDSIYKNDITEEEGINIIKKCLLETKKRVIVNFSKYSILIINKNGSRKLDDVIF